jgi:hypothetical protein
VTLPGATGVIAGFGPGITAEMAVGTWVEEAPRNSALLHGFERETRESISWAA